MQVCIFCDEWGSAAYPELQTLPLKEQIQKSIEVLGPKYSARQFLVYFQAYTSTFLDFKSLEKNVSEALEFPEVRGFVLGTRPDCLSKATRDLLTRHSQKHYVSVELGAQSFIEEQVKWLRRGHSAQATETACFQLREISSLQIGVHLMFGLPNETDEGIRFTAQKVSSLPIDHVKLHNLHVLKNTPLEAEYLAGSFEPVSLSDYARRVTLFLQHLDPRIKVQRLGAVASRWGELVAPRWTTYKMRTYQSIIDYMNGQGAYQGQLWSPPNGANNPFMPMELKP